MGNSLDKPVATFTNLGSMGELGNQMFQVATVLGYSEKHNKRPVFLPWVCKISGNDYTGIFKNPVDQDFMGYANMYPLSLKPVQYMDLKYIEAPSLDGSVDFIGYFQSEKYFENCKELVKDHFQPADEIVDYMKSKYKDIMDDNDYICLHIRTAKRASNDYDVHAACDSEYLKKALKPYDKNKVHVVFADNMELAKEMLPKSRNYRFIENEKNYVDLFLMNYFKTYIISASTFGWWGAWLSKHENPEVTIMKDWFNPEKSKAYLNDNDITPDTWKKI